jgi:hypothetical protein
MLPQTRSIFTLGLGGQQVMLVESELDKVHNLAADSH